MSEFDAAGRNKNDTASILVRTFSADCRGRRPIDHLLGELNCRRVQYELVDPDLLQLLARSHPNYLRLIDVQPQSVAPHSVFNFVDTVCEAIHSERSI